MAGSLLNDNQCRGGFNSIQLMLLERVAIKSNITKYLRRPPIHISLNGNTTPTTVEESLERCEQRMPKLIYQEIVDRF